MKKEQLEELVEQKVNEKTREIREENRRLKQEIAQIKQRDLESETSKATDGDGINRRQFLKKLGLGAAGAGALALTPASALDFRSNTFGFYNQASGGLQIEMDSNGNLDLQNNSLIIDSKSISDSSSESVLSVEGDGIILPANDTNGTTTPGSDLSNGEVTFEHDEYLGDFIIRFRDSSGTIQTVTLTVD
jgi:hypothetical protein